MARRGRKRKQGVKRLSNGAIRDADKARAPDKIDPTPEMQRKKRASGGAEINNPLSYIPLTHGERNALERYFADRARAGWSGLPKTSKMSDYIAGGRGVETFEEREARIAQVFRDADDALKAAGRQAEAEVKRAFDNRGKAVRIEYTLDLIIGARALADHYHIDWRDTS